jgi:hypothetical protein
MCWKSSVGIATRLRARRSSNRGYIPSRSRGISILHSVQTSSGAHPASYPMNAEVNQSVREAEASHSLSAEVKNTWKYTSTPPNVFMTWCLITHRGDFTFLYLYRWSEFMRKFQDLRRHSVIVTTTDCIQTFGYIELIRWFGRQSLNAGSHA